MSDTDAIAEADEIKKTLGIGASLNDRINKVVSNQYQYATSGDSRAFISEISRLTAALAEARELLGAFYRADIDPHKYDRTAQWLERNP